MPNIFFKIQEYNKQNPFLVSTFIILEIIIIALIVFIAQNALANHENIPNTEVSGIQQEIKDLPEDSVKVIQAALYNAIVMNGGAKNSLSNQEVQIRQDSVVNLYFESINMHYVKFIVDIPSIEQSYQVFREWSDDGANKYYLDNRMTLIMCLDKSQAIYPDFECRDKSGDSKSGQRFLASEFLKYFDFNEFNAFVSDTDSSLIYVNPINLEPDDNTKKAYIQKTREAVSSLGISPDIFQYYVLTADDLDYTLSPEDQ